MYFRMEDLSKMSPDVKELILVQAKAGGFNVKQGGEITVECAQAALDHVAAQAAKRHFPWYKKMRPHDTIEAIANFKPPKGDYSVGIEHETNIMDGDSIALRKKAIDFLKDCDYVCVDSDGALGRAGAIAMLEATFPPVLYSTIGKDWDAARYVDFLGTNKIAKPVDVNTHNVGIHVNMAKGDEGRGKWYCYPDWQGYDKVLNDKYFGRNNNSLQLQRNNSQNKWIEFRMFNATLNPNELLWYVEASRTMIDLMDAGKTKPGQLYPALEKAYDQFWSKH